MNNIGNKIKELRTESKMTQKQLAETLNVSYQAVSKWETGFASPDLSMIMPIAKLFHISTDELLGHTDHLSELNILYIKAMKLDELETLKITKKALKEYPHDPTFLYRRAFDEFSYAKKVSDNGQKQRYLALSVMHFKDLIKEDPESSSMLVQVLSYMGRYDEAMSYAVNHPYKEELFYYCLTGDKLEEHCQNQISIALRGLIQKMCNYNNEISYQMAENMIRLLISDENYLWYYDNLMVISYRWALLSVSKKNYDEAVKLLQNCLSYAKKHLLLLQKESVQHFTAPLFNKHAYNISEVPKEYNPVTQLFKHYVSAPEFDVLRERKDFISLVEEVKNIQK